MSKLRTSSLLPLLALCACGTLSLPEERRLGEKTNRQVLSQVRLLGDPVVRGYVADIGRDILGVVGPQPFPYRFGVVVDDRLNAFAIPGGYIYVHTGLLLQVRDVDELAGVMGHEVGHVALRHSARNYKKHVAGKLGYAALVLGASIFADDQTAETVGQLGGLALVGVLNSYTREGEREADDFAVGALHRAGYDPEGLPSFFETLLRMKRQAKGQGQRLELLERFLSSHPSSEDRIRATRRAIARLGKSTARPPRDPDGIELERIQHRIRWLLGRR